ncbi:MAG: cytochrome P450 [Candidatus Promineifilaceae bacterium]
MKELTCPIPALSPKAGWKALKALINQRSLLAALEALHAHIGNAFRITLPAFQPVVLVGPENSRPILVTQREKFNWRTENDPVTKLLRRGLLVEDSESHHCLRNLMSRPFHRRQVQSHISEMGRCTDIVIENWQDGQQLDMLVEMRRAALLILMRTLFGVEFQADMEHMWRPILRAIDYISPGLWLLWKDVPRFGFNQPLKELDDYLYDLIRVRRETVGKDLETSDIDDLLTHLIKTPHMTNNLIRDQLLTMLIAGHDTSTAMLSWALYLLGRHPQSMAKVQAEIDTALAGSQPNQNNIDNLPYLDQVIKETLRLYPPIHIGSRRAAEELTVNGHQIPVGTRVMYSIYLAHRDPKYWPDPAVFRPERFVLNNYAEKQPPFTYLPFGGGPRNCIGATFAQIEARVVLSRILQQFSLHLLNQDVRMHMGATLEPRPGVHMRVNRRRVHHD